MKLVAQRSTLQNRKRMVNAVRKRGLRAHFLGYSNTRTVKAFCLTLLGLAILASPGCSVFYLAKRTIKYEPRDFDITLDEAAACKQYAIWAEEAWGEYLGTAPDTAISVDYEQGFHEGFVDYVFAGGSGEPPPVPPRRFWRTMYRNPEGDQTVTDWMSGFRVGANVAKQGGYRKRALVPTVDSRQQFDDEQHSMYGDSVPPSPDEYEIIEDPVESYPPISKSDAYMTSPTEGEIIQEAPIGEGVLAEEGLDDDIVAPEEMTLEPGDDLTESPSDTSDILEFDLDSTAAEDAKTNPFIDDPVDGNPVDGNPLELPEVDPSKSPQDEFLPDEDLYDELFGKPDEIEQEAYRRDAIPSDRVIQVGPNSSNELVYSEPPLGEIVPAEFAVPEVPQDQDSQKASMDNALRPSGGQAKSSRMNPFEIETIDTPADFESLREATEMPPETAPPAEASPAVLSAPPNPFAPNPFAIDPLESDPFDEITAPVRDAEKRVETLPAGRVDVPNVDVPNNLTHSNHAPATQPIDTTPRPTYADAIIASQSDLANRANEHVSNTPIRREDWFISGLNDRKKTRANENHSLPPDAPSAVDRIADQLVGSPSPGLPYPQQGQLPQIVVPPQRVSVPVPALVSQPSIAPAVAQLDSTGQETNPISLASYTESVPAPRPSADSELMTKQQVTEEVEPTATLRIHTANGSDESTVQDEANTAPAEVQLNQSRQPTQPLTKMQTQSKSPSPTKLVFKSSASKKKKTNATRELIRARNAFRGPEGVRTSQDTYSGLFQQN